MRAPVFVFRAASLALALALIPASVTRTFAQAGAGGYGAAFLKIPVGARLSASPDVVAGMHPDATAMYANPSFLSTVDNAELFATSGRWLDQVSFTAMGAAVPLGRGGTVLGVGSSLLYSGGLTGYDAALNAVAEDSYYDLALDLALGHRFAGTGLSLALGVTYVREHVLPSDGSGYAFQAGGSYRTGRNLFHVALRDFSGSVKFDSSNWKIAPEIVAGIGRVFTSSLGDFVVGAQIANSDAYSTLLRFGVDYSINRMFTLRTGFNEGLNDAQVDSPFNAGFGMRYGAFSIEYAYVPRDYFSATHTFSLLYSFGAMAAGGGAGAFVPPGDFSPPVPPGGEGVPPRLSAQNNGGSFLLVGGAHATIESAREEAHALELLTIPARVDAEGPRFRVVVGQFASFDEAAAARARYRSMGHEFQILAH